MCIQCFLMLKKNSCCNILTKSMGIRIHVDTEGGQNVNVLTARPHFRQVFLLEVLLNFFGASFWAFWGGLYEAIFFGILELMIKAIFGLMLTAIFGVIFYQLVYPFQCHFNSASFVVWHSTTFLTRFSKKYFLRGFC